MSTKDLNWDYLLVNSKPNEVKSSRDYYEEFLKRKELISKIKQTDLKKMGLSGKDDSLLHFLLSANLNHGNAKLFRRASTANDIFLAIWISIVITRAKLAYTKEEIGVFGGIDKNYMKYVAKLSPDESIIPKLPEILKEVGIILIYEESIPGMKLDGVVQRLENGTPVIGMSLRYNRLDYFWFTLMHELAHIVKHYDILDTPIIDELEGEEGREIENDDQIELEANRLAKSSFVERAEWRNAPPKYSTLNRVLLDYSKQIGIHPAIIAGFLRHEQNDYTRYSKIIHGTDIRKLIFE